MKKLSIFSGIPIWLMAISLAFAQRLPPQKPLSMRIASQMISLTLLAQTPEPAPLPEPQPTPTPASPVKKPRVTYGSKWGLCGRKQAASRRSSGFTGNTGGTYIRDIQVDLHSNTYSTITLNWANDNLSIETLPIQFNASPGAGNCALDCRWRSLSPGESIPQSKKPSSHCTPQSPPTYLVQGYDCALTKYPEAKFVTWFHWEREIAFHAYTVPPYPASHGCIRLLAKDRGAEWIYDNSLAGITQINISWDELDLNSKNPSPKCWSGDRLIPRPKRKPR